MSIDEAIAHEREVAEEQRKDNDNCKYKSQYGCKDCADYYSKPCIECAKEHEQLAEWLEELKILREEKSEFQIIAKDIAEYNYEMGMENGYNKAIDDLIAECENAKFAESDEISLSDVHTGVNSGLSMAIHFAEQLKVGGVNGKERS